MLPGSDAFGGVSNPRREGIRTLETNKNQPIFAIKKQFCNFKVKSSCY
jgi:hypothetical protein